MTPRSLLTKRGLAVADRTEPGGEVRPGSCEWCNGPHEGGETVSNSGYWWHHDCAEDELHVLEEALEASRG